MAGGRVVRGSMSDDGEGWLVYEPVRRHDGGVDIEASVAKYAGVLDAHLRKSWVLRVMKKRRRAFVVSSVEFARNGWMMLDT